MKKNPVNAVLVTAVLMIVAPTFMRGQVTDPKQVANQDASNHANNDVDNTINNGLNKTENGVKGLFRKKNKTPKTDNATAAAKDASGSNAQGSATAAAAPAAAAEAAAATAGPVSLTAYSNYDFVPGEQVVFEDHFTDDQDGEFPAHWRLDKGQGIINKIAGDQAFFLTQGNYVRVAPRMKTEKNYLPENFTVEFDFYPTQGSYMPMLMFSTDKDESRNIQFGKEVGTGYFHQDFSADYPGDKEDAHYFGRWHHAAMIKKGNQIKCYEDLDASRLTTKGFGDTKPLNDNNTQEGKANNRRVEFVKK